MALTKSLVCFAQIFVLSNFTETFQLSLHESHLFPGGLTKYYEYSQFSLVMLIVYLFTSLLLPNFLSYLQEYSLAFVLQVEFFSREVKSRKKLSLTNILKDLGFVYKLSLIMPSIAAFK